jgi:hypothetical protein
MTCQNRDNLSCFSLPQQQYLKSLSDIDTQYYPPTTQFNLFVPSPNWEQIVPPILHYYVLRHQLRKSKQQHAQFITLLDSIHNLRNAQLKQTHHQLSLQTIKERVYQPTKPTKKRIESFQDKSFENTNYKKRRVNIISTI